MPVRFKRMHYYHVPVSPDRHRELKPLQHPLQVGCLPQLSILHVNPFKGKLLLRCVHQLANDLNVIRQCYGQVFYYPHLFSLCIPLFPRYLVSRVKDILLYMYNTRIIKNSHLPACDGLWLHYCYVFKFRLHLRATLVA